MELDDFKSAWQALDTRLARQHALQLELLRDRKLSETRRGLRGFVAGGWFQLLLGIALIVLGVACWTRNIEVPGLLATGLVLHAFGVVNVACAGFTLMLAKTIDYGAAVTTIQRQLLRLQRFHGVNSALCGAPWWVMWVLVVVGFAGLGKVEPGAGTPAWIAVSFWIGVVGMLATWIWAWRRRNTDIDADRCVGDGADGLRRGRRLLDELQRFEQQ